MLPLQTGVVASEIACPARLKIFTTHVFKVWKVFWPLLWAMSSRWKIWEPKGSMINSPFWEVEFGSSRTIDWRRHKLYSLAFSKCFISIVSSLFSFSFRFSTWTLFTLMLPDTFCPLAWITKYFTLPIWEGSCFKHNTRYLVYKALMCLLIICIFHCYIKTAPPAAIDTYYAATVYKGLC